MGHEAKVAAAAAAATTASAAAAGSPQYFPLPPYPTMVRYTPSGKNIADQLGLADVKDDDLPAELPGLRVLEALSASGLRSVRYAREVPGLDHVVCNDLDPAAVASISTNVAFNGIAPGRIQPSQADATLLMYLCREPHTQFDVIDLDPYGTAVPFLDGAVQSIVDGGLMAVTCTDMAVLASQQHPDACHSKYGAQPVKARHCHEQALRIVLAAVESAANRYGRTVRPLMCVSVDFYVRLFLTVHVNADEANTSALRLGHLMQCTGCEAYWVSHIGTRGGGDRERQQPQPQAGAGAGVAAGTEGGDDGSGEQPQAKRARVDHDETAAAGGAGTGAGASASSTGDASQSRPRQPKRAKPDTSTLHKKKVHAACVPQAPGAECPHCGRPVQLGGPIWSGPIHDPAFAARVRDEAVRAFGPDGRGIPGATSVPDRYYDIGPGAGAAGRVVPRPAHDAGSNDVETIAVSRRRLQGLLRVIASELPDAPLYYDLPGLCSRMNVNAIPLADFWAGLRSAGFRVSSSHCGSDMVKTDAPPGVVWGLLGHWEGLQSAETRAKHRAPEAAGRVTAALLRFTDAYLATADAPTFDLTVTPEVREDITRLRDSGPRFVSNPGQAWGPGSRASAAIGEARAAAKAAKREEQEQSNAAGTE